VGGTHCLRVEEEDWGGGVNRDLSSMHLVLTTHTRSGMRRPMGSGGATPSEIWRQRAWGWQCGLDRCRGG
jgi:hypothetical protein